MSEEKFTLFWRGPMSQWYKSSFKLDGIEYCTAEQWMMAEKARLFGDEATLKEILKSTSPRKQKELGREVKNFVVGDWNKVARNIVYNGNYLKFSKNKDLLEELMKTKGTTLVEASPVDRIWGIGLADDDPRALRRETWLGKNWLGEVLTKVRDDLEKGIKTTEFYWSG